MADVADAFASQRLPLRRSGGLLAWVEQRSLIQVVWIGMALYLTVVIGITAIELAFCAAGKVLVLSDKAPAGFLDILYFNFVTILTIGYGDFHPVLYGKVFSVIEAFVGVGLFSVLVAVITVKALLPPQNAIVFSRYAYYCTEARSFLIVFVNTTNRRIGNVELCHYFKLGGDWTVTPSIRSPFITRSVQTFYFMDATQDRLISSLREGDCLRVGIAGAVGFTNLSTFIQYSADRILVIPNRKKLVEFFEPLQDPDFRSPRFEEMFHYRPEQAATLTSFVETARSSGANLT